jgi:glycosyltransferase involved in cell wall biosynthesis
MRLKKQPFSILKILRARKIIKNLEADVVIVYEAFVGVVLALYLLNSGIPLIVSERVNPDILIYAPHKLAQIFRPWIYRKGVVCTVQTVGFQKWVDKNWDIDSFVVPNHIGIDGEMTTTSSHFKTNVTHQVIAVGRLVEQKDYETFLNAWNIIEKNHENAQLSIYGEGDREMVLSKISNLSLKRVALHQPMKDIRNIMLNSSMLISSSRFEGFPNVVLEALSAGIPVVATRSTDVIDDLANLGGLLAVDIGNYEELARQTLSLLEDHEKYSDQSKLATITSQSYSWSCIKPKWEIAINRAEILAGGKVHRWKLN